MKGQRIESGTKKGFPIIEFLVVVFIIAILAAIAIPDFYKFCAKSPASEAKTNLGAIFTTQVAYFDEHKRYASGPECFRSLGWGPEGETLYSYYCGSDVIKNTKGDGHCPAPEVPPARNESFTIFAVGNIDNDEECDAWTMNDGKILRNVMVDP